MELKHCNLKKWQLMQNDIQQNNLFGYHPCKQYKKKPAELTTGFLTITDLQTKQNYYSGCDCTILIISLAW